MGDSFIIFHLKQALLLQKVQSLEDTERDGDINIGISGSKYNFSFKVNYFYFNRHFGTLFN